MSDFASDSELRAIFAAELAEIAQGLADARQQLGRPPADGAPPRAALERIQRYLHTVAGNAASMARDELASAARRLCDEVRGLSADADADADLLDRLSDFEGLAGGAAVQLSAGPRPDDLAACDDSDAGRAPVTADLHDLRALPAPPEDLAVRRLQVQLSVALGALGRASKKVRADIARLGARPPGFEGEVSCLQRASEALCRMCRVEWVQVMDRPHGLTPEHEARIRREAHTHLGTIKGYVQLILDEVALAGTDAIDPEANQLLARIADRASDLVPLVDRLRSAEPDAPPAASPGASPGASPAASPTPAEPPAPYAPPAPARLDGTRRVLVMHDDPAIHVLVADESHSLPLEVLTAGSGEEGLAQAERGEVDLILLGVRDDRGLDLLRRLGASPATADVPVVALAADPDRKAARARCLEAGAVDCLADPPVAGVLGRRVSDCLRAHERLRQARRRVGQARDALAVMEAALDTLPDAIALYDLGQRLQSCNRAYRALHEPPGGWDDGVQLEQLLRAAWDAGLYDVSRRPGASYAGWSQLWIARHMAGEPHMERLADGRWIEVTHGALPSGGTIVQIRHVTRLLREEERLRFLAFHDVITALPNAAMLEVQLPQFAGDGPFVFLSIQLEAVPDEAMLRATAEALLRIVRAGDLVAYLGGVRFAVLLAHVEGQALAAELAARTARKLGRSLAADVHVAMACSPETPPRLEALLDAADRVPVSATD